MPIRVCAQAHAGSLRAYALLHEPHVRWTWLHCGEMYVHLCLASMSSTVCVGACGSQGGHRSFPIMAHFAQLQNVVSLDPLYWVAARAMFFHKMPALLPLNSNETSPGSKDSCPEQRQFGLQLPRFEVQSLVEKILVFSLWCTHFAAG